MTYGAVIVAAGLSSRMGRFKPLLQVGSKSVVKHVISAFQSVGIRQIVLVTGHNANLLTEHLADFDVVFLHNSQYQTTQMFDSAKIGLSYLASRCDRVLFTPVDVPLFSTSTVSALMKTDALLAAPLCGCRQGHPLMLSSTLIDQILADCGDGGLKGAVSRLNTPMTHIPVEDPGTLYDADTPEEFQTLLALYRSRSTATPSNAEILCFLDQYGTPDHVRAHCIAVAEKAAFLAAQTALSVNSGLLRAAGLLHDIARTSGRDHAWKGAGILQEAGYTQLAEIIGQHHDLSGSPSVEAQLLFLADKLIQDTRDISIKERFEISRKKCTTPSGLYLWKTRYECTIEVIKQLHLDFLLE